DLGSPVTAWKFTMPASNVTATAQFKKITDIVFAGDGNVATCDAGEEFVLFVNLHNGPGHDTDLSDLFTVTVDGKPDDSLQYLTPLNCYLMCLNQTPGSLSVGDHTVEVFFKGNDDYTSCSGSFVLTITSKITGITLNSDSAKKIYTEGDTL
ncbi:MAG: hypothetical protein Q3977_00840, partial [Oscillospiraceae bacterium]|nr:hypothetical protein [Oscillospiraceae bacterium]